MEKNAWEQLESLFDWAPQIKEAEINRWRVMYGTTPDGILDFIRANFVSKEELQEELERLRNTSLDHRLDAISVLSDLLRLP